MDGREYMAIEQNPEKPSRWGPACSRGTSGCAAQGCRNQSFRSRRSGRSSENLRSQSMSLEDASRLQRRYGINYSRLCRSSRAEGISSLVRLLREHLPVKWFEVYSATASHVVNVVNLKRGTFEYYCDL
jgi:hypothetical protein